jgi:hypothetical protein
VRFFPESVVFLKPVDAEAFWPQSAPDITSSFVLSLTLAFLDQNSSNAEMQYSVFENMSVFQDMLVLSSTFLPKNFVFPGFLAHWN